MGDELDLSKPGKLWAAVENEATTTFHLVLPQAGYTKDALSKNPAINPADELMTPFSLSHDAVAKDGVAVLDLEASGRAAEIMDRLTKRYDAGGAKVDKVKGVVLVTAKDGNKVPDKQLAEVKDFTLIPIPIINLKGQTTYVTVQNFKNGVRNFVVQLSVMGPIREVELTTAPGATISVNGQSGATVKTAVDEGKNFTVNIAVPFVQRNEQKQEMVERAYIHYGNYEPGGWNSYAGMLGWIAGATAVGRGESTARYMPQTYTREIWEGAQVTLRATGTGLFAGIRKSVVLTAESWANAWLAGPPPPPFYHSCC
ncbi:MAG TPA: hypothetical protein VHF22_13240 [Planctomycetota bacterium]|nr:hypothetical protein [Planctomycetota bacterium]